MNDSLWLYDDDDEDEDWPHPIGGLPHSLWEINLPPSQPTLSYRVGTRGRGDSGITESPPHNGEGHAECVR